MTPLVSIQVLYQISELLSNFGCLGLRTYMPFLDCTTLGLNGVLQENNTLWARCLGCSIVKDIILRFIICIIARETYLCQSLDSVFKQPNTIQGITPNHGIKIVNVNQGLIPASWQRLIVVASATQPDITRPNNIISKPRILPNDPKKVKTTPINTTINKATYEMRVTPQYSLRLATPSKLKYFL